MLLIPLACNLKGVIQQLRSPGDRELKTRQIAPCAKRAILGIWPRAKDEVKPCPVTHASSAVFTAVEKHLIRELGSQQESFMRATTFSDTMIRIQTHWRQDGVIHKRKQFVLLPSRKWVTRLGQSASCRRVHPIRCRSLDARSARLARARGT